MSTKPDRRQFFKASASTALGASLVAPQLAHGQAPAPVAASGTLVEESAKAQQVRLAIENGIKFLFNNQQKDGSWPDQDHYDGGLTPLCVLAMLNCGVDPTDERLAKSLSYMTTVKPLSTYATSLQTMAFCAADPSKYLGLIARNVKWLISRQHKVGSMEGMWAQKSPGSHDHTDNSMTHFAILALYEAERVGVPIDADTWRRTHSYWLKDQKDRGDGSWGWGPGPEPGTGSMTCAGIASLIITSGQLGDGDAKVEGDTVLSCRPQAAMPSLDAAFAWLLRRFSVANNPGTSPSAWYYYYLYSLERAGRMTAQRFIGKHDWYREGVDALLRLLKFRPDGSWPAQKDYANVSDDNVSTAFALMFLGKGRRPVVVAQLKHGPKNDWNPHRSAMFNLMSYVERLWKRDLTYQVVDIQHATVEDLLEAPIVYLSGRAALDLNDQQKQNLRLYVDRGGFIFALPGCDSDVFDAAFRKLMREMFPEEDADLRVLEISHPAWYAEEKIDSKYLATKELSLEGINVGCRTAVIYCPNDLSCLWELARAGRESSYSQVIRDKIQMARSVGANVIAYATNREVKYKDPVAKTVAVDTASKAGERGRIRIAKIMHPGGCTAAPRALKNLIKIANEKLKLPVEQEAREIRLSDPSLFDYQLVMMHGRTAFKFTPAERDALRLYLDRGGVMFVDSLCSSTAFTDAFRDEMKRYFPEQPLKKLSPSEPFFTTALGGEDITSVTRRQPREGGRAGGVQSSFVKGPPALEAMKFGDTYGVIFSPYDISCALDSQASMEFEGYVRIDAAKIALNVMIYALGQ